MNRYKVKFVVSTTVDGVDETDAIENIYNNYLVEGTEDIDIQEMEQETQDETG